MAENFWKSGNRYKCTDSRSWENQRNQFPQHIIIKLLKNKDKGKNSRQPDENTLPLREKQLKFSRFLIRDHEDQKEVVQYYSSAERKEVNSESYN